MKTQRDGKIVIGVSGSNTNRGIARLHPDFSVDESFSFTAGFEFIFPNILSVFPNNTLLVRLQDTTILPYQSPTLYLNEDGTENPDFPGHYESVLAYDEDESWLVNGYTEQGNVLQPYLARSDATAVVNTMFALHRLGTSAVPPLAPAPLLDGALCALRSPARSSRLLAA